jgi:hypothetical protein
LKAPNPAGRVIEDFNGDSIKDIITGGWQDSHIKLDIILGHSNIDSLRIETFMEIDDGGSLTPIGDINGDGQRNVYFTEGTREYRVLTSLYPTSVTPFDSIYWRSGISIIKELGDVNFDGIDDLYLFYYNVAYPGYITYTSILAGDTAFVLSELFFSDSLWGIIDIGKDLNGDGFPEGILMDWIDIPPGSTYYWYDLITLNKDYSIITDYDNHFPEYGFIKAFPNPFNESCIIEAASDVKIYDINGRMVKKFEGKSGNRKQWCWKARDENGIPLPSGVYFVKNELAGINKKVVYLK